MTHKYRVVIKYHIIETREFEFEHENPDLTIWDAFDFSEEVLGFDAGKVMDREVISADPSAIVAHGVITYHYE